MNDNEEDSNTTITLVSRDGISFELPYRVACLSKLVLKSVEDPTDDNVELPIPRVGKICLRKVVEFLDHFQEEIMQEIQVPLGANSFDGVVQQQWYRDFVAVDEAMLFELVTAANYMEIQPLLDLATLKVSVLMMGKSAGEIQNMLNIPAMDEVEERNAREQQPWIFDDA